MASCNNGPCNMPPATRQAHASEETLSAKARRTRRPWDAIQSTALERGVGAASFPADRRLALAIAGHRPRHGGSRGADDRVPSVEAVRERRCGREPVPSEGAARAGAGAPPLSLNPEQRLEAEPASLDDVAVVGEAVEARRGHLGVFEDDRPLREGQPGGGDGQGLAGSGSTNPHDAALAGEECEWGSGPVPSSRRTCSGASSRKRA